jgi:hypothetical protein
MAALEAQVAAARADAAAAQAKASEAAAAAAKAASRGFQWWQVVPWLIAGTAANIAYRNYRRGRFPHVRIMDVHMETNIDINKKVDQYLAFRLYCYGSDLYNVSVRLGLNRQENQKHITPNPTWLIFTTPEGLRYPIKNGQFVKYRLPYAALEQAYLNRCPRLRDVPPKDMWIAVYASDDVLVKRKSAAKFARAIKQFDQKPNFEFVTESDGSETIIDHNRKSAFSSGVRDNSLGRIPADPAN